MISGILTTIEKHVIITNIDKFVNEGFISMIVVHVYILAGISID